MRFVALLFIVLLIPILTIWLRMQPRDRKWVYFAFGALPFIMGFLNADAAVISWRLWPGYAKGLIVTVLDSLAIVILLTTRGAWRQLPFKGVFIAYLAAVCMSIPLAELPMSSFFYAFQVARVAIVFVAVAVIVTQPSGLRWLCFGLASGAIFQGFMAIQDWLGGALQAAGTMGHQNLLGMMLHAVTIPLLALLFAGEKNKLVPIGVLAGLIAVGLGASRGSIGFIAVGIAILFAGSVVRGMTPLKWKIMGLSFIGLAIAGPIMVASLERRMEARPLETGEYDERAAFEEAARMMWSDHPLGVGANQYVVQANLQGYNQEAGVIWAYRSRGANVHNLYLLAGAETGYFGFITLIALMIWPVVRGLQYAWRHRGDPRGEIVFGFAVAVICIGLHSLYEWIFVLYPMQYMFAIALGVIAGMIRQERYGSARPARLERDNMALTSG